jgi:hypothetical protein
VSIEIKKVQKQAIEIKTAAAQTYSKRGKNKL